MAAERRRRLLREEAADAGKVAAGCFARSVDCLIEATSSVVVGGGDRDLQVACERLYLLECLMLRAWLKAPAGNPEAAHDAAAVDNEAMMMRAGVMSVLSLHFGEAAAESLVGGLAARVSGFCTGPDADACMREHRL